jgi:hypothetical protein
MRFSYIDFVKNSITAEPVSPSNLIRQAINAGACEQGNGVLNKIRKACESLASTTEYKRIRKSNVKGYLYKKVEVAL